MKTTSTLLLFLALALCLTADTAAAAAAAPIAIPSFDQWQTAKSEGCQGDFVATAPCRELPMGELRFCGAAGGNFTMSASTEVAVEPGQDYAVEFEVVTRGIPQNTPAYFVIDSFDSAGAKVSVNGGGFARSVNDIPVTRKLFLDGAKVGERLRLHFDISNRGDGQELLLRRVTLKAVPPNNHTPALRPEERGGVIINEDCTHVFVRNTLDAMNEEALCRDIDHYLPEGHQVKIIMLNPCAHNSNYPMRSCPVMWDGVTFHEDGSATDRIGRKVPEATVRMYNNMRALAERKINLYHLWISHLRTRGVSPWISMRMNDAHDAEEPEEARIEIRKAKYRVDPLYNPMNWQDQGLNYEMPEVYDFHQRILFELMEEFDADGFEMDWMRFGRNFKHGREMLCAPILTRFMREARRKADEMAAIRGHRIAIAARVPSRPQAARRMGYDVAAWAREGLVDIIIPTNFLTTSDSETPVAEWRAIVGDAVKIAPCIEVNAGPYDGASFDGDAALRRGYAATWFHQGADMVYLYNHLFLPKELNDPIMCTAGTPESAYAGSRRHPVTFPDFVEMGAPRIRPLPATAGRGDRSSMRCIRLFTGPAPEPGRAAYVILGATAPDAAWGQVVLNSVELQRSKVVPALQLGAFVKDVTIWEIPDGVMMDDENVLEFSSAPNSSLALSWIEIYVAPANSAE